ncbi:unnamed protein product [Sphagnum tenellum]
MICFGDGQVGWDESTAGEKQWWVPLCKIEPLAAPFLLCPPTALRSKRPRQFRGDPTSRVLAVGEVNSLRPDVAVVGGGYSLLVAAHGVDLDFVNDFVSVLTVVIQSLTCVQAHKAHNHGALTQDDETCFDSHVRCSS